MDLKQLYQIFLASKGVNTDTRNFKKDQLFFALTGGNFDGNQFVEQALKKGAAHVVCSDHSFKDNNDVTVVNNPLETLQNLSTHHRCQLEIPVLGLTGSNGKTTTKELILSVLSQKYRVAGTSGNLNNHIGVPLTLLSMNKDTEIGVIEMGANHQREIAFLCKIARPNYGIITNFGKAHLEGFGGLEGVKKGKSELYDFLKETNGKAIVLPSDSEQMSRTIDLNRSVAPSFKIESSQPLKLGWNEVKFKTQLTGVYNVSNLSLAAAVGLEFGCTIEQIKIGLSSYLPQNNRSQIIERGHYKIIMDAYNANPTSMEAALKNLSTFKTERIAILGDMFELGDEAFEEHQRIANLADQLKIEKILLVGSNFYKTRNGRCTRYETWEELKAALVHTVIDQDSTVLIKGSRGMSLERVLSFL